MVTGQKMDWEWELDRLKEVQKRIKSGVTTLREERDNE
jgi:hypothetical protein